MHHEVYTGMTGDGVFAGKPHEVFVGGIPDAADAPPFELKAVEQDTLVKIQQRYDSVVPRLEALFPDGKTLCHLAFRWITVEWSWCVFTNGFSTHTYNSGFSTPSVRPTTASLLPPSRISGVLPPLLDVLHKVCMSLRVVNLFRYF